VNWLLAWSIALVCSLLRPEVSEALLGDLDEASATQAAVLNGLIGYLARSQWQAWGRWRPWLVLAGFVLPAGLVLNLASGQLAGSESVYVWMYAHNWTATYLREGWLWSQLLPMLFAMAFWWLMVAAVSLASGFILVKSARNTAWLHGIVLVILLMSGRAILQAVLPAAMRPMPGHEAFHGNAAAFVSDFYSLVLPSTMQCLFLIAPALFGMRVGQRRQRQRQTAHSARD
jgi:hypothetical protein